MAAYIVMWHVHPVATTPDLKLETKVASSHLVRLC